MADLIKPGTHVEFEGIDDAEGVIFHGVVQNYLPPEGDFKGGYHIACYYVISPEDVTVPEGRTGYASTLTEEYEDTVRPL